MKIKKISFLFAVILFLVQPALAADNFFIGVTTTSGRDYIRIYSNQGKLLSDIPIGSTYDKAEFLAGKWLSNDYSVVALVAKKKKVTAYILNSNGSASRSFYLGKKITRVLALDYNNNGISDLIVQSGRAVQIYLDPGINQNSSNKVKLLNQSDAVPATSTAGNAIASMKLEVMNQNILNAQASSDKLSAKKNFIKYKIGKVSGKIKLTTHVQSIYPVKLANDSQPAFVIQTSPKKYQLISKSGSVKKYSKAPKATLFSGYFSSETSSDIVVASDLDYYNQTVTINLFNPTTNQSSKLNIALSSSYTYSLSAQKSSSKQCKELEKLYKQFEEAYRRNDIAEATRLYYRIREILQNEDCTDYDDDDSDSDSDSNSDSNSDSGSDGNNGSYVEVYSIAHITNVVQFGSNTGMARTPCTEILNARDGKLGFLAKNSDTHPGTVYLTPSSGYSNGVVLNPRNFKVMYKTQYSGVANGGRSHFRLYSRRLPFGNHIFAATHYSGKTTCWKVPGNSSRVD